MSISHDMMTHINIAWVMNYSRIKSLLDIE